MAMGVHVDSPNALSIDDDLASPLRHLRQHRARQPACDKRETRQRAGSTAQHFSPVCHPLRFPLRTILDGPKLFDRGESTLFSRYIHSGILESFESSISWSSSDTGG